MDNETAIAAFRALALFSDFTDEDLRLLAFVAQDGELAPGDELSAPGDTPGGAHVLVSGQLEVRYGPNEGHGRYKIVPPALIGELGLIVDKPRTSTIVALRRSTYLFIARDAFMKLLRSQPDLAQSIADALRSELLAYLETISDLKGRFR